MLKMKRPIIVVATALCLSMSAQAQNDADALRYSMLQFGSTARALGAGGAFGAMGGDFGSISINPAGLGVYRSSEIQFSPGFSYTGTNTDFLGTNVSAGRSNLNIGSLGFVFTDQNERYRYGSGMRRVSSSFAFGVNRLATFSSGREFSGFNADNSILDAYAEYLNSGSGTPPGEAFNADPFGAGLAYDGFLLNPIPGDTNRYYSVVPDGNVWQSRRLNSRGSVTEMLIAMGFNFGHKLYIGASVGIPFLKYVEDYTYTESDRADNIPGFTRFDQRDRLDTRGTGINAKLGVIVRPVEALRIGGAIHSPTRYRLSDEFSSQINSDLDGPTYEVFSPFGLFDYGLRTPWRAIGSAGVLVKDYGFISLDYEYLDYGFSRLDFTRAAFGLEQLEADVNNLIELKYTRAHNIRGGVEARLDDLRLRAGYGYMSSPFAQGRATEDADMSRHSISGGFGYRGSSVFVDLAYVHNISSSADVPYQLNDTSQPIPVAINQQTAGYAVVSMGFRF